MNILAAHFAKRNMKNCGGEKEKVPKPARIPPQTPPAGGKSAEAKRKIQIPRKKDFRFAESALVPPPARIPGGQNTKEKHPFLFQKKFHPRQIRNARSVFPFGVAGVLASAWGFLRAYDLVSLHHARGACDIICFGSRCEFGTIETPEWNLAVENQPMSGRAVGTPTLFRPFSPMNSDSRLRRDGLFFRQEAGAKSEAILTHSICLIQKEFLLL